METNIKKQSVLDKYKGKSFAETAEAIDKRWSNRVNDPIEENSFNIEMEMLVKAQEVASARDTVKQQLKQFRNGGQLNNYENGTPSNGLPTIGDPAKPDGVSDEDYASMNLPTPNPLASINPLDNRVIPQVNTLNANNIPKYTLGEKIGKTWDNIVGDRNNPTTNTTTNTGETSAYTPALIGQGISTALNLGVLANGYDKVDSINNPYESNIKRLMASRGIDTTQQRNQILSAYNAARNNVGNTRSANVNAALTTNLMNVTQDNLAESKLQEQQLNNNYVGEFANVLNNLGQQQVQAATYAEDMTARNKGNFQSNLSAFGASMADNSKFFTTSKLNEIQNKLLGDILNSKYSNVGLSKEVVQRLSEGKLTPDDITVLKNAYGEEAATQLIKKFGE